jgi:hypothetical protein
MPLDLNPWVRLDRPGVYQVKVVSHRVFDPVDTGRNWVTLQSNAIELHMVPATPEWQDATLAGVPRKTG